jgi:multidrug efflux pump subunit AcrA (membrane-fusion protein)
MDNSNFGDDNFPGEVLAGNFHKQNYLGKIGRELTPDKNDSVIPFPEDPDYATVQSVTPEEFLPAIGKWVSVGGVVMVGSFGAAIGLSTFLKYKITVQAPATVRPMGELRLVQSTIEGSIENISVQENQVVEKGEQIATVRDLRLESKLETKRDQLIGDTQKAKQQISALDLQIRMSDAQIRSSDAQIRSSEAQIPAKDRQGLAERDRNQRAIAAIRAELIRAQRDHHDRQITSQAEVAEAEANWKTAQQEQQVAAVDLQIAAANLKSIQASYQSAFVRSQRYQTVAAAGAISKNQLEEAQLTTTQQFQAIAAQQATMLKQKQIVARLGHAAIAAATRIQRTQTTLNPSPAESTALIARIAGEQANGQAAIAILQQERQKLVQETQRLVQERQRFSQDQQRLVQQRNEVFSQIAANDREIAQIALELQPTPILAPISGTIQDLNLRNNAQVVRPGDQLAQIMPTGTPLNIKAYVAISDISNVKVGQTVQMRVSACPYTDYGVGSGKVVQVSADAKSIDKNAGTGSAPTQTGGVYEVTIKPTNLTLKRGGKICQIRSGMDGRTDIISKEETVLEFMLKKARLLEI